MTPKKPTLRPEKSRRPLPDYLPGLRWLLGYRGPSLMTRRNLRYDLISEVIAALALGMVIPELTQFVLKKGFEAAAWMLALVQAQFAVGNMLGAYLTQYLGRVRRVRVVATCRYITAGFVAAMAFLPLDPQFTWAFVLLLFGPTICQGVVLNVRNALRHANYPASAQGRIYSRLIVLHLAAISLGIQTYSWVLDHVVGGNHLLYGVSAGLFLLSGLFFVKIRSRGQRSMRGRLLAQGAGRRLGLSSLSVLFSDRLYGLFMLFQMLSGASVLMVHPVMAEVLADPSYFDVSYTVGAMTRVLVPLLTAMVLTIPVGAIFDRIGINRFRACNAGFWISSRVLFFFAIVHLSGPLLVAGFVMQGFGRAIGGVAFNIGHTRFSHAGNSHLYMGAHMILQGVRGTTLPFLGIWLFTGGAAGPWLLLIAAGVQFVGLIGFLALPEPQVSQRGNPGGA